MGTERSAFHSGPEDFPPTKAVSIRVDPICHSHFSLATRRRTIHSGWPTIVEVNGSPCSEFDRRFDSPRSGATYCIFDGLKQADASKPYRHILGHVFVYRE